MIAIRTNFLDQAGLKIFARARKLLVPPRSSRRDPPAPRPSCGPAPPTTTSTPS
jgi:hypothetical protein